MSASLSTVDMPEDRAYLAHHFNCPACCAAGRTPGMQQRCTEGLALWDAYQEAWRARDRAERQARAARLNPSNRKGDHP